MQPETLSEIDLSDGGVARECKRRARAKDLSPVNYISPVDDGQSLPDVVIRDQDPDAARGQPANDLLDVEDRDRVDPGEGLVEQEKVGREHEAPRDLHAPPLAAREREGLVLPQSLQPELGKQCVAALFPLAGRELECLENREQVLLDRHPPEDRRLLRKVGDPGARPPVHGQLGQVLLAELHHARVRRHEADDDRERRRLAGAVGAEEPDDLARGHLERHVAHDRPPGIGFDEAGGREDGAISRSPGGPGGPALRALIQSFCVR
jgi:hypothetical protein